MTYSGGSRSLHVPLKKAQRRAETTDAATAEATADTAAAAAGILVVIGCEGESESDVTCRPHQVYIYRSPSE